MDRNEFKGIWIPLTPDFYRLAFLILKSEADAKDIVQDLFIKLWNSRDELGTVRNPKGYGLVLIRNMCIDKLRKTGRTTGLEGQADLSGGHDPEQYLDERQRLGLLKSTIERLPEDQKRIVRLRFFEDKDYDEIAQTTGLSPANVRVLVCRARDKIRKQMKSD